jgi:hypothetical protein
MFLEKRIPFAITLKGGGTSYVVMNDLTLVSEKCGLLPYRISTIFFRDMVMHVVVSLVTTWISLKL